MDLRTCCICRELLCRGTDDNADRIVQLKGLEEGLWWLEFTGQSTGDLDSSTLKQSVSLRELCFMLGVAEADIDTTSTAFYFAQGCVPLTKFLFGCTRLLTYGSAGFAFFLSLYLPLSLSCVVVRRPQAHSFVAFLGRFSS